MHKSIYASAVLAAAGAIATGDRPMAAQQPLAEGTYYNEELVREMDVNTDGKVSKAEFMNFMDREFNYLDKDKGGFLDNKEIMKQPYLSYRSVGTRAAVQSPLPDGAHYTQEIILVMDVNKDGKISKAEFMKHMEDEFNVLDKGKSSIVDNKEIVRQPYMRYRPAAK